MIGTPTRGGPGCLPTWVYKRPRYKLRLSSDAPTFLRPAAQHRTLIRMSDQRRQFVDQRYVFFVTFSVYKRRRLLDLDQPKRIVLGELNARLKALAARCVGFVIMPDHVHSLLWLPEPRDLRRFLQSWKRLSSYALRRWYAAHAPNYFARFGPGDRFWQPKSYTFHIYSERKLEEKLQYVHLNPVRAGLVSQAVDWRWSSARWYERRQSVGVPISWVEC